MYNPLVHTLIVVHKHLVADGAICKPMVVYVDRRLQAFGGYFWGLRRRSQALGGYVDRRVQAFGGIRGSLCTRLFVACVDSRVEAFGGLRGSPLTSLLWHTWITVYKLLVAYRWLLVAYVDHRVEAFGGIRGLSFASLYWLT